MYSRSRNSEAAQRFAERRRREDEAPRLRAVVPTLATLRLEVDQRHGAVGTGDPKHVRLVVVDSAAALFSLPCGNHACREGGHELTERVLRALSAGSARIELSDTCQGNVENLPCGATVHVVLTATYR